MKKVAEFDSCANCEYLHEDSEAECGYTLYSYMYCDKVDRYTHLKSFPFKKSMPCFVMSFWVAIERDEQIKAIYEQQMKDGEYSGDKAYTLYKEKYVTPLTSNIEKVVYEQINR